MLLTKKFKLTGRIRVKTGLRVGTGRDVFEIGGIDLSVIKFPNGVPYIPGSSIKGKMRCLMERTRLDIGELMPYKLKEQIKKELEKKVKRAKDDRIKAELDRIKDELRDIQKDLEKKGWKYVGGVFVHACKEPNCEICTVFGRPAEFGVSTPTRVIVRDAALDEEHFKEEYPELVKMGLYTEVKAENAIDRLTSAANPRHIERVPKGARFEFELIYSVYDEKDEERFRRLFYDETKGEKGELLVLVENDYIGGMGSRGYGKVEFEDLRVETVWERKE